MHFADIQPFHLLELLPHLRQALCVQVTNGSTGCRSRLPYFGLKLSGPTYFPLIKTRAIFAISFGFFDLTSYCSG